jgi:hypothetical protein
MGPLNQSLILKYLEEESFVISFSSFEQDGEGRFEDEAKKGTEKVKEIIFFALVREGKLFK